MNGPTRVRMVVHGRVQGVGFRAFVQRAVRGLNLDGYVRNRPDGTVEIEAAGPTDGLARLREAAAAGPAWAEVARVEDLEPGGDELPRPFGITH